MSCGGENVKVETMDVYLGEDQAQVQKVTCVASSASASLNNKYFALYASTGARVLVQIDVNNTGTPVVLAGYTVLTADIAANPVTAEDVATAVQVAVDASPLFTATVSGKYVTITDVAVGAAVPAHDSQAAKTGFAFEILTLGDLFEKVGLLSGSVGLANLGREALDIIAHQSGGTVLGQVLTKASSPEISMSLLEVTQQRYDKILRYSSGSFLPVSAGSTAVLGGGTKGLFQSLKQARCVMHPTRLGLADKSQDYCFWKTTIDLDSLDFDPENLQVLPVVLKAQKDCDKQESVNVWMYGDWSQNINA
jgi:hypothetical protein